MRFLLFMLGILWSVAYAINQEEVYFLASALAFIAWAVTGWVEDKR